MSELAPRPVPLNAPLLSLARKRLHRLLQRLDAPRLSENELCFARNEALSAFSAIEELAGVSDDAPRPRLLPCEEPLHVVAQSNARACLHRLDALDLYVDDVLYARSEAFVAWQAIEDMQTQARQGVTTSLHER